MSSPPPADPFELEFNRFFLERLRPEVETVEARKKSAVRRSLVAGAIVFLLFAGLAYHFTRPYYDTLGVHDFTVWPLLLLLPAAMGVIGFSITYIMSLRSAVGEFRTALIKRLAEFVDPGVVYEGGRAMEAGEFAASRFFGEAGKVESGKDHFRGRDGAARYEFAEIRWEPSAGAGGVGKGKRGKTLTGIFYSARFDRRFRGDLLILPDADPESPGSVLAGALLAGRNRPGIRLFLSERGDKLAVALLGEEAGPNSPALLDGFDFGNCREFCRDARLCLEIARALERDAAVWE